MYLSLAQITASTDVSANADRICKIIDHAARRGSDLVVFPEASMYPFGAGRLDTIAEPLDGPFASQIREAAQAAGLIVVVGMFCPADSVDTSGGSRNRVYNVALVVGRDPADGEIVETSYRKIHCYDAFGTRESDTVQPGKKLVYFPCAGMTVGVAICYDIRFPGQFRNLANGGAELIVVPTSWSDGPGKLDQWRTLTAARALDSTSWIAAVGQPRPGGAERAGQCDGPTGIGHSVVVSPDGIREAELGYNEMYVSVDVDEERVAKVRKEIPVLQLKDEFRAEEPGSEFFSVREH